MRAFLFLALAARLGAQSDLPARLDQIATTEQSRQHLPGLAIAAIREGKIVYAKGFGVASTESKAPITPDTLFRTGQSTKFFVSLATVILADQGRLHLDKPVGDTLVGLNLHIAAITPDNILSNATGLKDDSPNTGPHDEAALAREVASFNENSVFTAPGRTFSSSNLGFVLGGRLLEVVKGEPFADVMDELIFRPWGMTHTTFRPTVAMSYPLAAGHSADGKVIHPTQDNAAYSPAFSLYSSANDLARAVSIVLNNGTLHDMQLVSPQILSTVTESKTPRPGLPGTGYGYGIIVDNTHSIRLLRLGVAVPGYDGAIVMAPESRSGVIVLTNQSGADPTTIADKLFDRVWPLGVGPAQSQPAPAGGDLVRYLGKYSNGTTSYDFSIVNGVFSLKTSGDPAPLEATTGQCFRGGGINVCFTDGFAHVGVRAFKKQ
ncbi:MAG TPA: serine hydrolase domain-containing protein [Bryobacteraceae bacterium]|jgi:CubicO group peptidase (beta-lactamase class C family)